MERQQFSSFNSLVCAGPVQLKKGRLSVLARGGNLALGPEENRRCRGRAAGPCGGAGGPGRGQGRGRDEDSREPSERDSRTQQLLSLLNISDSTVDTAGLGMGRVAVRAGRVGQAGRALRATWRRGEDQQVMAEYRRRTTEGCPGCRGRRCRAGSLRAEGR